MKDLGPAQQILGMKIVRERTKRKLWLSQEKYIERVLERFNMKSTRPVSTPLASHLKLSKQMCPTTKEEKEGMAKVPYSSAVGSLMYAMVCTRPDIAHAVCVVSRFLENTGKEHWEAVKWILRYLRGTTRDCLYFKGSDPILKGYTDADMAGGAISWQSKLQKCVALSTTEAEYIAATEAGKKMVWLKRFLQELGLHQIDTKLFFTFTMVISDTSYGNIMALLIAVAIVFCCQSQLTAETPNVVVSQYGTVDFTTIAGAIRAAPNKSVQPFYIKIKQGIYREYIRVYKEKTNIVLIGEGMGTTIITGNRSFNKGNKIDDTAIVGKSLYGFLEVASQPKTSPLGMMLDPESIKQWN
uniref:Pectinesterase catalytic domain-containing protein n=1 Tax=Solanum lycopersicum TaxID=4081 RepID=A0A3Q7IFR1_SOLLC